MKREFKHTYKLAIVVVIIVCLLLTMHTGYTAKNNNFSEKSDSWYTPILDNVWNISTTTIIENKTLYVARDIIVEGTGSLILKNSILLLDTRNAAILIEVLERGKLILINSTITSKDFFGDYAIAVHDNAAFYVENSEISYAGANFKEREEGAIPGVISVRSNFPKLYVPEVHGISYDDFYKSFHSGLIIRAQNVTIKNSRIINVKGGLFLRNSNNSTIKNNLIRDCDIAVNILGGSFIVFDNNTILNCDRILIGPLSNSTISRNIIKNIKTYFLLSGCRNVLLLENSIEEIGTEFRIEDSISVTIAKNTLKRIHDGIVLETTYNVTIYGNTISGNTESGLIILGGLFNNITDNAFFQQGISLQSEIESTFTTTILSNNTVNNRPIVYILQKKFSKLRYNNTIGELIIALSERITIDNLQMANSWLGVEIIHSGYIKLINSSMKGIYRGIVIKNSRFVSVENSTFENCNTAIEALQFTSIDVKNNIVTNASIGIYYHAHYSWYTYIATRSRIQQNIIKFSNFGILVSDSETTFIENNIIANNGYGIVARHSRSGIYMIVAQRNNISENQYGITSYYINNFTIRENIISHNEYGIFAKYSTNIRIINNTITNNQVGIYLNDTAVSMLSDNTFTNNTVILQKAIIESKVLSLVCNLIIVWVVLTSLLIYIRYKKKKYSLKHSNKPISQ